MPNSTQSLLQSTYSEMLGLATAVGELRARHHHVSHRLDLLERQQSELATGLATLRRADSSPIIKQGRRFLPHLLSWLWESSSPYILRYAIPALVAAATVGRKLLQALLDWAAMGWQWLEHWLVPLLT